MEKLKLKLNDIVYYNGNTDMYRIAATRRNTLLGKGSNPYMKEMFAEEPYDYIILKIYNVYERDGVIIFDSKGSINAYQKELKLVPENAINKFVSKFYDKYGEMMTRLAYE